MGAFADSMVEFAQPLIDTTDGSPEQVNKAFAIAQLCYNLALLPEESREEMLAKMQESLAMDDEEFAEFRSAVVDPMIRRHEDMFGRSHRWDSMIPSLHRERSQPCTKRWRPRKQRRSLTVTRRVRAIAARNTSSAVAAEHR